MESCIAISSSKSLLIVWAKKDAGVACVIEEVETIPVFTPFKDANSIKLLTGLKSFETPIAPLYVFSPVAKAVALAAESVISLFDEKVSIKPISLKRE